jgi:hypothetical protein
MNPETRFSGHWIVATPGTGKTNLLLHMVASDLKKDASVIIMDSKGELTQPVRELALGDRLIVVDPDKPFAINPFDVTKSEHVVSQLGYMLSGLLETNITAKQRTFFETIVAALLSFPNPSLPLLWDIVSKGPKAYKGQINQLPEDMQSFFWYEWDTYSDTTREMQWRLRGLLGKKLIKAMLSAPKTKFDIGKAMDQGKVVVIDNSQAKCTAEGCGFIGRLFVAQIWSAGTARALISDHLKKPTYVYIDEAHLVIKKDQKIAAIIDELRSQKIGLILAHQKVRGQIDDINVLSSLENCAIKMVNVGAGERDYFSKLLGIPPERMKDLPRGHFATDIRWEGASIKKVPKAVLPYRTMTEQEKKTHQERMNTLYGYTPKPRGGSSSDNESSVRGEGKPAMTQSTRQSNSAQNVSKGADPHTGDHTDPASKWGDS